MKAKHRRILEAIFAAPTRGGLIFADMESLLVPPGEEIRAGEGFRGGIRLRVPPEVRAHATSMAGFRGKSINQWAAETLSRAS